MNLLDKYLYAKDDIRLFCRLDIPHSASEIVVIAHGYEEHCGRYLDFAQKLVTQNIGVCLLDHRGHGKSLGTRGDIEDFFLFVEDMKIVIEYLKRYNKKLITFGHSMGGLITFIYGLRYKDDVYSQIFSSPALGVPIGCKHMPEVFYELIDNLLEEVKFHKMGEELAIRNKFFLEEFKNDKACNQFVTMRFIYQFIKVGISYAIENAKNYKIKSLFLLGEEDHVIPIDRNKSILEQITFENKKIITYPKCMHDLLHDLDTEIDKVILDIIDFIRET